MKTRTYVTIFTATSLLAGCKVGPDYKAPTANPAPQAWAEPQGPGVNYATSPVEAWWSTFNDPQLTSLIQRAAKGNHDLKIATARLKEARAQRGVVASRWFPQVDAASQYQRQRTSENLNSSTFRNAINPESDFFQGGFDMSWELDFFGHIGRAVESADADIGSAAAARDAVLVSLLGEVGRNYMELRGLQKRLDVTRQNVESQRAAVDLTRSRFNAGLTTELDVKQAQAQLANTESTIPNLESSAKFAIHRLGVLLGQPPESLLAELSASAPIPTPPPEVPVGLPSDVLRRRPDIAKAERDLASSTALIGVATADLFPRFSITGSYGLQSNKLSNFAEGDSQYWSIGPSVRWPILNWGRIRDNIKVQDAKTEAALAQYEKTLLTSLEEVENALVAYNAERVRYKSLADAVDAGRRALELSQQQYTSGLRDFLNVIEAQRTLFISEDALAQSEGEVSANLIAVYKSLGGGWRAADVQPDDASTSGAEPAKKMD